MNLNLLQRLGHVVLQLCVLDLNFLDHVCEFDLLLLELVSCSDRGLLETLKPGADISDKLLFLYLKSTELALDLLR